MYTPRLLERHCVKALNERKILVVTGPRQTGKSTLLRELVAHLRQEEKLFLNLDDPFLRDRLVKTERALEGEIERQAGRPLSALSPERPFHLVLDEAQKAPALFERIKALHDEASARVRIALTCSSSLGLHDPVAESLAGRVRLHSLAPFTMLEGFAHFMNRDPTGDPLVEWMSKLLSGTFTPADFEALAERVKWDRRSREAFARGRLRFPLFPEPCSSVEPEMWIRDYLATYLEKDVQSLSSVGNVALFRTCLQQLAARTGGPLKWEPIAQEAGTTSVTLRKYVGLMEETLNVVRLQPFALNPLARVVRAPKAYLTDPGLLWGLRGFEDLRLLEATGMLGVYMELVCVAEIAKWCSLESTVPELRYWRKTGVSEVDLVVSNRGYHIPFECKLGTGISRSRLRGLDAFEMDHRPLGLAIPYRVLLHMGEPAMPEPNTYAIPLWALT
jgi:uncharacterized protein